MCLLVCDGIPIGGMLNPIRKNAKTHYKKGFCNGFTGKS